MGIVHKKKKSKQTEIQNVSTEKIFFLEKNVTLPKKLPKLSRQNQEKFGGCGCIHL